MLKTRKLHQQAAPRPRQEVRKTGIPGQEQNQAQPVKPIQHGQQKSQAHGQEERQQGQNATREQKQDRGRND